MKLSRTQKSLPPKPIMNISENIKNSLEVFFGPERIDKFTRILGLLMFGIVVFSLIYLVGIKTNDAKLKEVILGVAFGLIPEFIGSIAVYWVLDSSIKQLYGITELPDLPLENFVNDIRSVRRVRVLETFTRLATNSNLYNRFFETVSEALKNGATIEILLLHPKSEGAAQRASELSAENPPVLQQIELTLARLYRLQKMLQRKNSPGSLEINLYKVSPSIAMHMWDRDAYVSFYPLGKRSDDAPNLKISMATTFGQYATAKFEELREHYETIALFSHMELKVILPDNQGRCEVVYCVQHDTDTTSSFYISCHFSNTLLDHLTSSPDVNIIVEGHHQSARCERLDSQDTARSNIIDMFQRKYDWGDTETESEIGSDAIIFKLELT
jgi:hypothetical protein